MKNKNNTNKKFISYYRPVIGLFLLDTFFAIILASIAVGTPFLIQYITRVAVHSDYQGIALGTGLLACSLLITMLSSAVVTKWGHIMGIKMEVNMRNDAIAKMQRLPISHFETTDTGTYISRIVSDLRDIPEFAHHGPEDFIVAVLISVGGFTYAFLQSWIIGVVLVGVFILGIIAIYFIRTKWRAIWLKVRENNSLMSASVGHQVEGISEIKSFNAEGFEKIRFQSFQNKYRNAFYKFYGFEAHFTVANIFILSITSLVTTVAGAYLLAKHKIDISQLVGLTIAAATLNKPMQKFVNVYTMLSRGSSSIVRFYDFMSLPEEINPGTVVAKKIKGHIEFKNVSFSYTDKDGQEVSVFKDFNLIIKPGEKIAIIGETGIGKSTLLKLILGFYPIQKGQILIDNININKYDIFKLRKRLGYVQQASILFHDSIKNNILYGNPDANDKDLILAAKDAHIHEFISTLENQYETIAGPRGAKLSGGQKQRIAIARTFLSNPDVLLMDEATSSLDNKTENNIKESVEKLSKGKTTIIIAHRLSTIKHVDKIIVLGQGGKILQQGKHEKLIKQQGYYKNMNI